MIPFNPSSGYNSAERTSSQTIDRTQSGASPVAMRSPQFDQQFTDGSAINAIF